MASLDESDDARSDALDSDDDRDLGMDHLEDDLATAYSWRIHHPTGDHKLNRMVPTVLSSN